MEDELLALAQSTVDTALVVLTPVFKGVDKPRDGMVLYADGTHFNPGAGAGSYEYRSGAWHKLAEDIDLTSIESDITSLQSSVATNTTNIATNTTAIAGPTAVSGFTNGSNAAAGKIGEYLSAVVQPASAVNLTANVNANVTSLVLTAGDWDVWADCYFAASFTDAAADCQAGLSTVSATLPTVLPYGRGRAVGVEAIPASITGMYIRVNVSTSTTYFLVAVCEDSLSGAGFGAYGQVQARRRR